MLTGDIIPTDGTAQIRDWDGWDAREFVAYLQTVTVGTFLYLDYIGLHLHGKHTLSVCTPRSKAVPY